MRLQHPCCIVAQAFDAALCRRVIELGEATETMTAAVAHDPSYSVRDSTVAWLREAPETAWLYAAVSQIVADTNARLWKWQISMAESMQYTHYGEDQHYGWHTDQRRKPYPEDDSRWPSLMRKLLVSVCLSDGGAFDGGDFQLEVLETPPDAPDKRLKTLSGVRQLGAAVIFSSHLYYRVTPLTRGRRRSLVAWYVGPPFV